MIPSLAPLRALACALALAAAAGVAPAHAATTPPPSLPLDLASTLDGAAQQALQDCLRRLQLDQAVAAGHLAVSLVEITDPQHPILAQVNGDEMFYAASLPKIAILLGAFEKAAAGQYTMDAPAVTELQQMIRNSSNQAASSVLNRVGVDYLAQVLESERYRLYDPQHNGGLWVGRAYASNAGVLKRDPLHGLSHGATAFQVSRFYYLLANGELVSPEASKMMKEIMGSPAIHHKFVAGLSQVHPEAALFRKSGTWRNFHADSALVERDGRRYIAVALSDDPRGGEWCKRLIVGLDDIVFSRAGTRAL